MNTVTSPNRVASFYEEELEARRERDALNALCEECGCSLEGIEDTAGDLAEVRLTVRREAREAFASPPKIRKRGVAGQVIFWLLILAVEIGALAWFYLG